MKRIKTSAKISGVSACVPKYKFLNINYKHQDKSKLKRFIKTTGIKERRIVSNFETCTSDLAIEALNKLLIDIKWNKKDLEFLIFITQTPDYLTPATSCIIQERLNLKNSIFNLDINYGCSGFPYGVSTAFSLIDTFSFNKGVLIIGDVLSKLCNEKDQSTWPLFGDGCAAVAFEKTQKKTNAYFDFYTDGKGFSDIIVHSHSLAGRNKVNIEDYQIKNSNGIKRNNFNLFLNGANIYSFSISKVPERINKFIEFSKINKNNFAYCFLHQANKLINNDLKKKIDLKKTLFPSSLEKFGNTSAATIPITMVHNFGGKVLNGLSILSGFGVGLSMSSSIYNFENCKISKLVYLK